MAVSTRPAMEESATSTFGVTEAWTESVLREISRANPGNCGGVVSDPRKLKSSKWELIQLGYV